MMRNPARNLTNNGITRQDLLDDDDDGDWSNSSSVILERDEVEPVFQKDPFMGSSEEDVDAGDMQKRVKSSLADYKGYYSKRNESVTVSQGGGFSKLPAKFGGTNINTNKLSVTTLNLSAGNDAWEPPEYDRYPGGISSRVASMLPVVQHFHHQQRDKDKDSPDCSTSSISSQHPFLGEPDYSPFGGYPATSFPLSMEDKEDDDYIHNPDPEEEAKLHRRRFYNDFKNMSLRSFGGYLGLLCLLLGGGALFVILPALTYTGATHNKYHQVITLLTDYQYPQLSAIRTNLVDSDTPKEFLTKKAKDGSLWKLVFSDEFNAEGRTFYDGEDQFWTAPNINYAATNDLEWYDPDAVTTKEGTLKLRMDAYKNHDLFYRSGMLQSWNKLCFTQGRVEASVNLPNYGSVQGLWPGMWTMGNLGRPGYMASTEGVWPYSYEECDAGITPNQSAPDGISYLPGQKLSVCTCDGEDHPNQGVGRGAPEIDMIEGEQDAILKTGVASQSLQVAPFDIWYIPDYDFVEVYNFSVTQMNSYCGGPFQQAVSAVTTLHPDWYEFGPTSGKFQSYGFELLNDDNDGYLRWFVGDTPTFTLYAKALHPNGNIGWRRLSKEPMSIILNLGISNNWAYIDWQMIFFPVTMSIDFVRIYQPNNSVSISCDPPDRPTYDYIQKHKNAYYNVNMTSWADAGYTFPKNVLTGNCKSSKFSNNNHH